MIRLFFSGILLIMGIAACNQNEKKTSDQQKTSHNHVTDFKKMQWLVGCWKGEYGNKPFYEAWRKLNDTLLMNYSIEISGTDTLVKAGSPLNVHSGNIYLGAKDSVNWMLSAVTEKEIILKNDTLKYSNVITWRNTTDGHWYTILKDAKNTVTYDLVRMPELDVVVDRFIKSKK